MTELLFRNDAYSKCCRSLVVRCCEQGVVLDRTVFYPRGGGQPGDSGSLVRESGAIIQVTDTCYTATGRILHVTAEPCDLAPGEELLAQLDWERRFAHMRMHTGLHLLGVVIPHGVTGGNISAARSRLDFDMQNSVDKQAATAALNRLIEADHTVLSRWITQAELQQQPELVRTMSVRPPADVQRLRLLEIPGVDLQPCGGTHVASTREIGPLRVSKVEKKGRRNRRVHIVFD